MRLSKNEVSPSLPYLFHLTAAGGENALEEIRPSTESMTVSSRTAAAVQKVADLMDLVADHRSDLLTGLLEALSESESTREHAAGLTELVAACGVSESVSPCATAMAISADLEKLVTAGGGWTHPAQIVKRPNVSGLYRLCAARLENEAGPAREGLEKILPPLERTARLTEKAAARRLQEAARASR